MSHPETAVANASVASAGTPIDIVIVGYEGVTATSLVGPYDLFNYAGVIWHALFGESLPGPEFRATIVALAAGELECAGGLRMRVDTTIHSVAAPRVIIVPAHALPSALDPLVEPPADWLRIARWLRQCHNAGSIVCAVSSGSMLLAETGLLDDREATTHWATLETMKRRFPAVRVRIDRALVFADAERRIITAGAGTCWQDLVISLIQRFAGAERAARTARVFAIFRKMGGQLPFVEWRPSYEHGDAAIAAAERAMEAEFARHDCLSGAVRASGLPERTFKRRFGRATGITPTEYLHQLRIRRARLLLETSEASIEEIAAQVGYADLAFFRDLFRRKAGMTPGQYRMQFSLLGLDAAPGGAARESRPSNVVNNALHGGG